MIQHEESCPLGQFDGWLRESGVEPVIVRAWAGESLRPEPATDALVVLGGSMNAEDDAAAPWLPAVRDLLRAAVAARTPTLGICMGHQLLGVALGGRSGPNPHGKAVGVYPIGFTDAADPLLDALPREAVGVQWNDDVVAPMPDDAVVLAADTDGQVQAARFGPAAWGVQWHPEVDVDILRGWAAEEPDTLVAAGIDAEARLSDVRAASSALATSGRALAHAFASLTRQKPPARPR